MKNSASSKILTIVCIALAVVLCVVLAICLFGSKDKGSDTPTPETPSHTHVYVDGLCECGTFDPNFNLDDLDKPDDSTNTTVTYTVTVVDQDGAPVVGAAVQLCVGDLCKLPCPTDENGVSVFNFEPADYSVKVTVSGYTYESYYYFDTNSTELTIVLTKN